MYIVNISSFAHKNVEPLFARVVHCSHWQEHHIQKVSSATSFSDVGALVCEIAAFMPKPLLFISGPMTTGGLGHYSKNIILFQYAIETAREHGLSVFNQTMLEEHLQRLVRAWLKENPQESYCHNVLSEVYEVLMKSGHIHEIHLLPDWHTSRGARFERELAEEIRLPAREFPEHMYAIAKDKAERFFAREAKFS